MPPLIIAFAVIAGLLVLVAVLPKLEVRLPRRYRDIIYVRFRRGGIRIDVYGGNPVRKTAEKTVEWDDADAAAFARDGMPVDLTRAAQAVRREIRPFGRFPFPPIVVLHPIERALAGLDTEDRRSMNRLGADLAGERALVGDLPTIFPDRAFQELRTHGLAPWNES